MAIIFLGTSKCPICGELLQEGDEIWGLPAIHDTVNPFYPYFDAGLHKTCFDSWDKRKEVEEILENESSNGTPPKL